jgi:hypothetical protein
MATCDLPMHHYCCSCRLRRRLEELGELVGDQFRREMRREMGAVDDLDLLKIGHVAGDMSRPLDIPGRGCL